VECFTAIGSDNRCKISNVGELIDDALSLFGVR